MPCWAWVIIWGDTWGGLGEPQVGCADDGGVVQDWAGETLDSMVRSGFGRVCCCRGVWGNMLG